jgi:hypothetical protein
MPSVRRGPPRREGALPNGRSNVLSGTQRIRRSVAGAHEGEEAAAADGDDQDSVDDEFDEEYNPRPVPSLTMTQKATSAATLPTTRRIILS